jgi:allophanate hydrolase
VQLIAPAFADDPLLDLASRWCGEPVPLPQRRRRSWSSGRMPRRDRTAGGYRMLRVPTGVRRAALVAGDGPQQGFAVEVWQPPTRGIGELAALIPQDLRASTAGARRSMTEVDRHRARGTAVGAGQA